MNLYDDGYAVHTAIWHPIRLTHACVSLGEGTSCYKAILTLVPRTFYF